jgi:hypothetical protein
VNSRFLIPRDEGFAACLELSFLIRGARPTPFAASKSTGDIIDAGDAVSSTRRDLQRLGRFGKTPCPP